MTGVVALKHLWMSAFGRRDDDTSDSSGAGVVIVWGNRGRMTDCSLNAVGG